MAEVTVGSDFTHTIVNLSISQLPVAVQKPTELDQARRYSTGFQSHYALAVCDPDAGPGTTHCLDGVTSLSLLTSRVDM